MLASSSGFRREGAVGPREPVSPPAVREEVPGPRVLRQRDHLVAGRATHPVRETRRPARGGRPHLEGMARSVRAVDQAARLRPRRDAHLGAAVRGASTPSLRAPLQPPPATPRPQVGHAAGTAPAGADRRRGGRRRVSAGRARRSTARILPGRGIKSRFVHPSRGSPRPHVPWDDSPQLFRPAAPLVEKILRGTEPSISPLSNPPHSSSS